MQLVTVNVVVNERHTRVKVRRVSSSDLTTSVASSSIIPLVVLSPTHLDSSLTQRPSILMSRLTALIPPLSENTSTVHLSNNTPHPLKL